MCSQGFREGDWRQSQKFDTIDNRKGSIEVFYLKKFPELDEGPFLKEERQLIENLASIISNYLNSQEARKILHKTDGGGYGPGGAQPVSASQGSELHGCCCRSS